MAKLSLVAGTTSKTVKIFVQNSSVTTGAGLTGLAYNTSGLTAYYIKEGDSSTTSISLVTATLGTWSSGGFVVVDGTNMPGVYELGIPNAALASGKSVIIYLQGATNMAPVLLEIELTQINNQSTGFGLVDASANVVQWNGSAVSSPATAGIPDVNVKNINNVSASSVTTINANQGTTQPVNFSGTGSSAFVKADAEQVNGQSTSASGTVTFPNATLASTTNLTAGTITTVTNLTNAPTAGDFTATMKTSIGTAVAASAVASVTGNVGGNVTGSVGSVTGNVGGSVASVTAAVAITSNVKKDTASNGFEFIMTSSTTHAPQTGLTVTSQVSIDGGSFGSTANSAVEIGSGAYYINLAASDVNGNHIMLLFTASGADAKFIEIVTQP